MILTFASVNGRLTDMTTALTTPARITALDVEKLAEKAAEYAQKARSCATRRAYETQWRTFGAWCAQHGVAALPAGPEAVIAFLTDRASDGVAVPTLAQTIAAIASAHGDAGAPSPTHDARVRLVWKGIRREHTTNARQARPLDPGVLRKLAKAGKGLAGARNRALLLLGFAGGFRRAELVALDVADVSETAEGLVVRVRRSKTDQEARGRDVGIPFGSDPITCPVRAWRAWLAESGLTDGAAFRGVRYGRLTAHRLDGRDVARMLQAAAKRARVSREGLSGHSLRSGLITTAAKAGKSLKSIMDQSGHKSVATVQRYIRTATIFEDNAAAGIGL